MKHEWKNFVSLGLLCHWLDANPHVIVVSIFEASFGDYQMVYKTQLVNHKEEVV